MTLVSTQALARLGRNDRVPRQRDPAAIEHPCSAI